jgi:competence protein ComEC
VSEWRPLVAAAVVALGAASAVPVPPTAGAATALAGVVLRRTGVVVMGLTLLASGLAHQAWEGVRGQERAAWSGVVTLGSDPRPVGRGLRVEVRAGDRRYEAWAFGSAAGPVRRMLTGERIAMTGRIEPLPPDRPHLARRHLAGRLSVEATADRHPAAAVHRLANGLRRTLTAGLDHLPEPRRALVTGIVFGDDRLQSDTDRDAFRRSGLTHLLAVSGQNVAFVLAMAAPLLGRAPYRVRLPATLALLGLFGLVTRFEPSVLRATAMAGFAALAASRGRSAGGLRVLALAVIAVLLLDPLLVGSPGFQLSVAASGGILVLARPIAAALPGPGSLRQAVAVTVAAQVAVAPLLAALFGPVPVASLPANVLAAPAAGPLMTWGLTAGLVAGVVGGPVAALLHVPTDLLARWLQAVGRAGAALPFGGLGPVHVAVLWAAAVVLVVRDDRRARALAVGSMAVILLHAAWFGPPPR